MISLNSSAILVSLVVIFMSIFSRLLSVSSTSSSARPIASAMKDTLMSGTDSFNFTKSEVTPFYFVSHGGPTFGDRDDPIGGNRGAFDSVKKIGQFVKETLKPDFVIVVSAHWQSNAPDLVEITVPPTEQPDKSFVDAFNSNLFKGSLHNSKSRPVTENENPLIYDFFGFPDHMYNQQFHTFGSASLAQDIKNTLIKGGLSSRITERGIDHGCWVPFRVAFGDTNSLDSHKLDLAVPLVQVSLTSSSKFDVHYKLGELLRKYRELNGVIICSGMSVHNLRDFSSFFHFDGNPENIPKLPYVKPFNQLITSILTKPTPSEVLEGLYALETDPKLSTLTKQAHPTNEHFLPIVVAAGVASIGDDACTELYTSEGVSFGWNIYEWKNSRSPANNRI